MTRPHSDWRADVLSALDEAAVTLFPGPPNENYPSAGVRLSGFRDDDEWLLVFQILSYGRPTGEFHEDWFVYGNMAEPTGFRVGREPIQAPPGEELWSDDEEERFLPDLGGFTVLVGGRPKHYAFTSEQLSDLGLGEDVEMDDELRLVRAIAQDDLTSILTPLDDLPTEVGRPGLALLFTVDGWQQPDSMEGEKPSDMPCFQAVADSIASGEAADLSVCGSTSNTHWSNWTNLE